MDPVARGVAALHRAGIPVVDPDGWDSEVRYEHLRRKPVDDTRCQRFIHWVGTSTTEATATGHRDAEAATLRSAERYHLSKGWAGLAYDVAFGNSGTAYLIRGDAQSAATSGDVDMDGIPNNVEGDALLFLIGHGQTVTTKAIRAARVFLAGHGDGPVHPHRDARGTDTDCPGEQLTEFARSYEKAPAMTTVHYDQAVIGRSAVDAEHGRVVAGWHRLGLVDVDEAGRLVSLTHPGHLATVDEPILVGAAADLKSKYKRYLVLTGKDRDATALEVAKFIAAHPRREPGQRLMIG